MKLIWNAFEAIFLTLSSDTSLKGVGDLIMNKIFTEHVKLLYSAMNPSCSAELTAAVLKLLTSILAQGQEGVRKVLKNFDFTFKGIENVARRRSKTVIRAKPIYKNKNKFFIVLTLNFLAINLCATIKLFAAVNVIEGNITLNINVCINMLNCQHLREDFSCILIVSLSSRYDYYHSVGSPLYTTLSLAQWLQQTVTLCHGPFADAWFCCLMFWIFVNLAAYLILPFF